MDLVSYFSFLQCIFYKTVNKKSHFLTESGFVYVRFLPLFEILCKYILMCLSLYLLEKVNLLYYFPIHLVKVIPRNPASIPISHPVWALPNIDATPAPRNVQPTNTNPPMSQFGRSILHPHPFFFTTYAICKLNFLAYRYLTSLVTFFIS